MYLLKIAARNVFRRRSRTLLISSILVLAVVLFILLESFMIGMMDMTFGNVVDFEIPHVEVGRREYFQKADNQHTLPLEETFVPRERLLADIRSLEGFRGVTPVLDFSADFISGRYEYPVRVRAVDVETFPDVFRNHEYVVEGEFVQPEGSGVVIGDELARFFSLEAGDFFTLRFSDRRGSFNTMEGEVKGIVTTPHPEMNLGTVFVSRTYAAAPLGVEEDHVTQLMIRLADRDSAQSQADRLAEMIGDSELQVRSYREAASFLVSLETWGYIETYFMLALFLLVGSIGIISAVVLAAIERVREIGMMKAMGLQEGKILRVFILEAGGIGAFGAAVGCLLGAVGVHFFHTYGIELAAFVDFSELGVPMIGRLYGAWNPMAFVLIFAVVTVIAVLASVIPAWWAAKKDPVEAIGRK